MRFTIRNGLLESEMQYINTDDPVIRQNLEISLLHICNSCTLKNVCTQRSCQISETGKAVISATHIGNSSCKFTGADGHLPPNSQIPISASDILNHPEVETAIINARRELLRMMVQKVTEV